MEENFLRQITPFFTLNFWFIMAFACAILASVLLYRRHQDARLFHEKRKKWSNEYTSNYRSCLENALEALVEKIINFSFIKVEIKLRLIGKYAERAKSFCRNGDKYKFENPRLFIDYMLLELKELPDHEKQGVESEVDKAFIKKYNWAAEKLEDLWLTIKPVNESDLDFVLALPDRSVSFFRLKEEIEKTLKEIAELNAAEEVAPEENLKANNFIAVSGEGGVS